VYTEPDADYCVYVNEAAEKELLLQCFDGIGPIQYWAWFHWFVESASQ